MKVLKAALLSVCASLMSVATPVMAAVPAFDAAAANTYLESNAGAGIALVGLTIVTLAALAIAIKWIKATFFG